MAITYQYRCPNCGDFEIERSIKDEPLKFCETCNESVHQIYSTEPLKDVWITSNPHVHNGSIHRFLQRGGTSGFNSKLRS